MPIVSHNVTSTTQADGSLSVVFIMYDQDARPYPQTFFAPPGFDVTAKVNQTILEMNEHLAQTEFETLVGAG